MKSSSVWRSLAPVDLKNIRRDSLLLALPAGTLGLAMLIRMLPYLNEAVGAAWGVDLTPYFPLFVSTYFLFAPGIAGMIVGFLLLDERDEGVLSALMVSPLPPSGYLTYRLGTPVLLGTGFTLAGYPLAALVPISLPQLVAVTLLASLLAPMLALFLASFADNKVSGFALVKMMNVVLVLPLLAYLYTGPWTWLLAAIPNYWALKAFWLAASGSDITLHVAAGAAYSVLFLIGLGWWFRLRAFSGR